MFVKGVIGMSQNKKYIVITGQIASGKSSLSKLIEERCEDYLVLDADDQVKELYKRGAVLYKVLVNEFGDSILNEKGNISKAKLRSASPARIPIASPYTTCVVFLPLR